MTVRNRRRKRKGKHSYVWCGRGAKGKATRFSKELRKAGIRIKPLKHVADWTGKGRRCFEVQWRE